MSTELFFSTCFLFDSTPELQILRSTLLSLSINGVGQHDKQSSFLNPKSSCHGNSGATNDFIQVDRYHITSLSDTSDGENEKRSFNEY